MAANPKPRAPWGEYIPQLGLMTVEQFEQLPTENGWMFELHQGRLISKPGPGIVHARIQRNFFRTVDAYLVATGQGGLDGTGCYHLPLPGNKEEVLCPDLSYSLPLRKAAMPLRGSYPVGAPDLAIEIASPSDTHPELTAKTAIYLQAGVRLVWLVWPKAQTIEVWRQGATLAPTTTLGVQDTLDGLDVIPGFQCAVTAIFAG
jgi:Uma2 family endonuclease